MIRNICPGNIRFSLRNITITVDCPGIPKWRRGQNFQDSKVNKKYAHFYTKNVGIMT